MESMRREGKKEEMTSPQGPITRSRAKKFKESLQLQDQDFIKPNICLVNYLRPENV